MVDCGTTSYATVHIYTSMPNNHTHIKPISNICSLSMQLFTNQRT